MPEEQEILVQETLANLWLYIPDLETHRPTGPEPWLPPNENGQIAYVDMSGYLSTMNPDGAAQRRIIGDMSNVAWPTWSHGGQYLAFAVQSEEGYCVYQANIETLTYTELACGFADIASAMAWSPQNEWLAFYGEREAGTGRRAWVLGTNGQGVMDLAPGLEEQSWRPVWVDEDTLVFPGKNASGEWKLYVVDLDQPDNPQAITKAFPCQCNCSGGHLIIFSDVSPDRQRIAFLGTYNEAGKISGCRGHLSVYLADPDPSEVEDPSKIVELVTSSSYVAMGMLKWSPDNRHVAVCAGGGGSPISLYIVDTVEGKKSDLSYQQESDWRVLSWSPDATHLLAGYAADSLTPEIVSIALDTQAFNVLTWGEFPEWGEFPAWGTQPFHSITDLSITHIEITQGLQDWEQNVPLVEGKLTFARVYVTATVDTPAVKAVLAGTLNGQPLPGSPLEPQNQGQQITVRSNGGDRGITGDSFYFELPDTWLNQGTELTAYLDPDGMVPEIDENNNITSTTLGQFVATEPIKMVFVRVIGPDSDKDPSFDEARRAATWLRYTYPVRDLELHNWLVPVPILCPLSTDFCQRLLLAELHIMYDLSSLWFRSPDLRVYGIVHQDVDTGGVGGLTNPLAVQLGDYFTWGKVGDTVLPPPNLIADLTPRRHYGRIMAHEIGHTYGLKDLKNPSNDEYPGCLEPAENAVNSPYNGHIGEDDPRGLYGFDGLESPPEIYKPTTYDLMTYCWDRYWISYDTAEISGTFNALLGKLRVNPQSSQREVLFPDQQLWLMASGIITPATDVVTALPFYVLPDLGASYNPQSSDYSISLYDANDMLLASHPFTLAYPVSTQSLISYTPQTETQASTLFLEVLPYDPATAYVAVQHGNSVLSVTPVSTYSPQITVTYPHSGTVLTGTVPITWEALDEDGDALSYVLRYSTDGGATWIALAVDLTEAGYALDTSRLPGTDQGVIQVIATDGLNTVMDVSDGVFTVPVKAPTAYIALPTNGSVILENMGVALVGSAYDPEDGPLADSQLTWSSSLDGELGSGETVFVPGLSQGWHTITLMATDSYSNYAASSIEVLVVAPAEANFEATPRWGFSPLTVVFSDTSSGDYAHRLWHFGDGITSTLADPRHTYVSDGAYTVTLTISGTGGINTLTRTNHIAVQQAVQADFTARPREGNAPITVTFTDASSGSVVAWQWAFGDDELSTLQHPTHTYTRTGVYTVGLTAWAMEGSIILPGSTDTLTRSHFITVHTALQADFSAWPLSGTWPLTVVFTNTSSGDYNTSLWNFGDQVTSTEVNPTHIYTATGIYDVSLEVNGPRGSDIRRKEAYITVNEFVSHKHYVYLPLVLRSP
ncbi:MAG: PKD domain-containing protein [Anaerolineae bacterium]|nr:PKD domain-containing protein [Anaerolineae bacterium]